MTFFPRCYIRNILQKNMTFLDGFFSHSSLSVSLVIQKVQHKRANAIVKAELIVLSVSCDLKSPDGRGAVSPRRCSMIHVLTDDATALKPSQDTYTPLYTHAQSSECQQIPGQWACHSVWDRGHVSYNKLWIKCPTIPVFKTSANFTTNSDVFHFSFSILGKSAFYLLCRIFFFFCSFDVSVCYMRCPYWSKCPFYCPGCGRRYMSALNTSLGWC